MKVLNMWRCSTVVWSLIMTASFSVPSVMMTVQGRLLLLVGKVVRWDMGMVLLMIVGMWIGTGRCCRLGMALL